jgi:hypothetical protein
MWVSHQWHGFDSTSTEIRRRDPVPSLVVWDVAPRYFEDEPILPREWGIYRFRYWLAIKDFKVPEDDKVRKTAAKMIIRASYEYDTTNNATEIWIQEAARAVVILLNDRMIQFIKPVIVYYGPRKEKIQKFDTIQQHGEIIKATLMARGDPKLTFSASIQFDPSNKTAVDGGANIFSSIPTF